MYDFTKRSGRVSGPVVAGILALVLQMSAPLAADRFAHEQVAAADIVDVLQATYGDVDDVGVDVAVSDGQIVQAKPSAQIAQSAPADSWSGVPEQLAQSGDNDINDPLEEVNRAILQFNEFIQALILRPVAELYVMILPDMARDAIRNALDNLRSPVTLANDLLQGEGARAWETTQRIVINSTIGVGGLVDVADKWGIKAHEEDLGQTFATWGVGEGFYLVLPLFGPSNPRDVIGKFLDGYLDPLSDYANNTDREEIGYTRTFLGGVDEYSRVMDDLKKLKETSIDYYAALRSVARQKRQADIANGTPKEGAPIPDLKYDFNAEFTGQ
jgi:phospholipid-binding lipoprotein MlaA